MAPKKSAFDLESNFGFYGAYHSNPINVLIHSIFVWPNFFSSLVLFHFTPSVLDASKVLAPIAFDHLDNRLAFNLGFFITLAHALFYVILDKKAGTFAALLCFVCWVGASFVATSLGFSLAWKVVLAAQSFAWTGQLLGHGYFEKRAPAFTDNFVVAFMTAPFFVLLEVLQKIIGYEPYPGFHERVKAKTEAEIKAWNETKQKNM